MTEKQKQLAAIYAKYLSRFPEAQQFLDAYGTMCEAIDDQIDRDRPEIKDYKMHLLSMMSHVINVFSCPFYIQNIGWLYPLIKNALRIYTESVMWEKETVAWKQEQADRARCFGAALPIAILEHLCNVPLEELVSISLLYKEVNWEAHHDQNNKPI